MNIQIINIFPHWFKNNLKDKNLINLINKLEPDSEKCSKENALILIKSIGNNYRDQINGLRNTDLDFLYVTKDTKNNCFYINTAINNIKIDTDNFFNNDMNVFQEFSYITSAMQYYDLVLYAII